LDTLLAQSASTFHGRKDNPTNFIPRATSAGVQTSWYWLSGEDGRIFACGKIRWHDGGSMCMWRGCSGREAAMLGIPDVAKHRNLEHAGIQPFRATSFLQVLARGWPISLAALVCP
jgi:hypothetical protein